MTDSPNTFPVTLPGDGTTTVVPEPRLAPEPVAAPVAAPAPVLTDVNTMHPAITAATTFDQVVNPPVSSPPSIKEMLNAQYAKTSAYTTDSYTQVSVTPNVVISNPVVRKTVNLILSIAGVLVTLAYIVDAALPQVDWTQYTTPAGVILVGIAGVFNLAVTVPNTPTS